MIDGVPKIVQVLNLQEAYSRMLPIERQVLIDALWANIRALEIGPERISKAKESITDGGVESILTRMMIWTANLEIKDQDNIEVKDRVVTNFYKGGIPDQQAE